MLDITLRLSIFLLIKKNFYSYIILQWTQFIPTIISVSIGVALQSKYKIKLQSQQLNARINHVNRLFAAAGPHWTLQINEPIAAL